VTFVPAVERRPESDVTSGLSLPSLAGVVPRHADHARAVDGVAGFSMVLNCHAFLNHRSAGR
jgi:hypothetical protein